MSLALFLLSTAIHVVPDASKKEGFEWSQIYYSARDVRHKVVSLPLELLQDLLRSGVLLRASQVLLERQVLGGDVDAARRAAAGRTRVPGQGLGEVPPHVADVVVVGGHPPANADRKFQTPPVTLSQTLWLWPVVWLC